MMQMNFTRNIKAFLSDEQGAELAEYAVAVALLVAVALVVYKVLGTAINDENSGTGAKVESATTFTP
jgi:Flp pilus assembly pilin Flp